MFMQDLQSSVIPPKSPVIFRRNWQFAAIWLALLLLTASLRLWHLDRLPPGLFYDEAFNGVDARAVLAGQTLPLYFAANNGREPLFIYLVTIFVHFLGNTPYVLRLCSAIIGMLTVPICYFAAELIMRPAAAQPATDKSRTAIYWPALIAAIVIALSFWHLSLSRLAFRVILLPPLSALAIACFWRAWGSGRRVHYGWAGFWLALTLYTYTAARLLPLIIVLFVLLMAVSDFFQCRANIKTWWQQWQARRRGLLYMALSWLFFAMPFFYTIYQDPSQISSRTDDISIFTVSQKTMPGTVTERLWTSLRNTGLSFYTQGDSNPRHNLPGRPFLDWPLALLFTLGWIRALWQIRSQRMQLLFIWFAVMLTPTIFSTDAPHTLRSAGALPPLILLIAFGAQSLYGISTTLTQRRWAGVGLLTLLLGLSGTFTIRDYFGQWATLPKLGAIFDTDLQLAAETVRDQLPTIAAGQPLLISRRLYLSPQMRFAIGELPRSDLPGDGSPSTATGKVAFLREEGMDANPLAFLLRAEKGGKVSASWLQSGATAGTPPLLAQINDYPHTEIVDTIHQSGWPLLWYGTFPTPAPPLTGNTIHYDLPVNFANGMQLLGYDVAAQPLETNPTQTSLTLTTYWQRPPQLTLWEAEKLNLFTHLMFNGAQVQDNGQLGGSYPLSLWEPNQRFDDRRVFVIEDPKATGKAYFEVGLFEDQTGGISRIDMLDGNGNVAADQVTIGATWIGGQPPALALASFRPLRVHFTERIALIGWQWTQPSAGANQLQVTLVWKALDRMTTAYTSFVHLLDAQQQIVAQSDLPPGGIDNPTALWAPGEAAQTVYQLPIEPGTDLSQLLLRVGLYEPVSGLQLPITATTDPANVPENATYLLLKLK